MDRNLYTKEECWAVADALAAERLQTVNQNCEVVQVSDCLYAKYGKRLLDLLLSGAALVVTFPINLFLLIGTYADVGSPVFFKQKRVGKDGKLFTVVKFRNMTNEKDELGELLPSAQRVTRFGKFVRRTSLDELLNFWSVFKGDMSIIGPRPLLPEYTHRYSDRHRMRLAVKPGLECPPRDAKVGRHSWNDQFENDIWYVEHLSFRTDALMCLNLVKFAFDSNATVSRGGVSKTAFMGYDEAGEAIDVTGVDDAFVASVLGKPSADSLDNATT